jgi:hypothetical protein
MREVAGAFAIACVLGHATAYAGDWTPRPDRKYRLAVAGSGYALTAGDRQWAENLGARLRKKGGVVESFEVAPSYPSATVEVNGTPSTHKVFRQRGTSRYLVVSTPDTHRDSYMVDFERRYVLSVGGIWTTSLHPHPSARFAVVIYSHRPIISGILVGGPSDDPTFSGDQASWY